MNNKILRKIGLAFGVNVQISDRSSFRLIRVKGGLKLLNNLLLPIGLLFVLVIRMIRPWILVRINILPSERIGHLAGNTELYLCERDAGINTPSKCYVDLWYHNWPISNRQLARMWSRRIHVGPSWLLGPADRMNSFIPGGHIHRIGKNTRVDRDVYNLLERIPSHLSFLPDEEERGKSGLRALGISEDAPFVCLSVRDSVYLKMSVPWRDWKYHDYRDSNIQTYILAAEDLANRGYYVIRMGALVKDAMKVTHPRIIDYAKNGLRSDFMDIYLGAKCKYFISTGTGIDAIAMVFRRPYVFVNYGPIEHVHTHSRNLLFIPKRHWLTSKNRFMTFREIFESGAGRFGHAQEYQDAGIQLVENTPEEIAAVALEMEARLNGAWQSTEEDEALQRRFWEIFPKSSAHDSKPLHGEIRSRIGADFLRQNQAWLQ